MLLFGFNILFVLKTRILIQYLVVLELVDFTRQGNLAKYHSSSYSGSIARPSVACYLTEKCKIKQSEIIFISFQLRLSNLYI